MGDFVVVFKEDLVGNASSSANATLFAVTTFQFYFNSSKNDELY